MERLGKVKRAEGKYILRCLVLDWTARRGVTGGGRDGWLRLGDVSSPPWLR